MRRVFSEDPHRTDPCSLIVFYVPCVPFSCFRVDVSIEPALPPAELRWVTVCVSHLFDVSQAADDAGLELSGMKAKAKVLL